MCVENTYVVNRCRRLDWYIRLRNVGKIEQHIVSTPPS